jgi:DNA replication protein DnaC
MSDLDPLLKRLHLANARRVWSDMCQRAEKEEWSYETLLSTLFAEEVAHRRGTRLARAVRAAQLPFLRTIEEFDFSYQSTLRLTTIGSLLSPDFVTQGHSVIFEGKPGRGKTHLAIAIAYRAMQNGFEALFTTAAQLIDELSLASREGRMREALARFIKPHVLVVDEVGYLAYGDDAANVLYHVVNDRHIHRRAMLFTTNKAPKSWGAVLHDDDLADAIVDRILERGRLLRLDGPSVRTKHLADDELGADEYTQPEAARVSGTYSSFRREARIELSRDRRARSSVALRSRRCHLQCSGCMCPRHGGRRTRMKPRAQGQSAGPGSSRYGAAEANRVCAPAKDATSAAENSSRSSIAPINAALNRFRRPRGLPSAGTPDPGAAHVLGG